MNHYLVTWSIDIEAETPEEAAEETLKIQRNSCSIATIFTVLDVKACEQTSVDVEPLVEPE
jgi:hypothetical protein